jgi:hypothetical protein
MITFPYTPIFKWNTFFQLHTWLRRRQYLSKFDILSESLTYVNIFLTFGRIILWLSPAPVCLCPRIKSRWDEIFRTYPERLQGPPSLLYNGYRVFPGGKGGRGVMLTTYPLLVPRLSKSWAIPPLTLWVLLDLLRGSLYLYLICP